MDDQQRQYRSYLLRLWRAGSQGRWVWRASLEDPRSGERKSFADLERLFAFLKQQTDDDTQTAQHPPTE